MEFEANAREDWACVQLSCDNVIQINYIKQLHNYRREYSYSEFVSPLALPALTDINPDILVNAVRSEAAQRRTC